MAPPPLPPKLQAPPCPDFEASLKKDLRRGLDGKDEPARHRWTTAAELQAGKWHYEPGAFFLGYRDQQVVWRKDDRHILLVAGSRAGKGVSVILPNCLTWQGSMLIIDPKGELARDTAGHRQHGLGQKVIVLDPFERSTRPGGRFNPLLEIDPASLEAVDQAAQIADGLIVFEGGGDSHWTDSAKELLKGIILYALTLPRAQRTLRTVRQCLLLSFDELETLPEGVVADVALYVTLAGCDAFDGVVAGIGKSFGAKPEKERGSILSTATTQTAFLDSPAMRDCMADSDFALRDLKRDRVTVYLCLPASHMSTHARWLRIVINMALAAFEDNSIPAPDPAVMFVLEEFNVLGHMASIATAAGQIAGYGVRLLTVLQDMTQLQRHYKESWETFIGNAGLILAFGNSDVTTLKYLSEKVGQVSVNVETQNAVTLGNAMAGSTGASMAAQTQPLAYPHELQLAFARNRNRLLVLFADARPVAIERSISHDDHNFNKLVGL